MASRRSRMVWSRNKSSSVVMLETWSSLWRCAMSWRSELARASGFWASV